MNISDYSLSHRLPCVCVCVCFCLCVYADTVDLHWTQRRAESLGDGPVFPEQCAHGTKETTSHHMDTLIECGDTLCMFVSHPPHPSHIMRFVHDTHTHVHVSIFFPLSLSLSLSLIVRCSHAHTRMHARSLTRFVDDGDAAVCACTAGLRAGGK